MENIDMQELAEYLRKLGDVQIKQLIDPQDSGNIVDVALVPEGYRLQSLFPLLNENLDVPRRRKGVATVTDLESLINLTCRGADQHSALFANREPTNPSLTAILNYNQPTVADPDNRGRYGDHRIGYSFPVSNEWKKWIAQNGKPMDQGAFAAFVEGAAFDIIEAPENKKSPVYDVARKLAGVFATTGEMQILSRGMTINVNENVQEIVSLGTGEMQVNYSQTHTNDRGKPLKIPSLFLIGIPVFDRGTIYQIAARLRYRKNDNRIMWFYQLFQPEKSFDDAFDEACNKAKVETKLPLFYGSPEA